MAEIDSRYAGNWTMEKDGLEPIVEGLRKMGYQPENALWPAALRISRAPALVDDLLSYVAMGQPPCNSNTREPAVLFRLLPGGHTVASLSEDFNFMLVGSFMMAAELVADQPRAESLLAGYIEKGYWTTLPDGKRILTEVPAAKRYPSCPRCSKRWAKEYDQCPGCGYRST